MSSVYALKPRFQAWLRPAVARLAAAGITANQVTLAAAGASMLLGVALYAAPNVPALWLLLPLFLFVRMALNAIDGMLAREHGQQSALGACLNELGDVFADALLYLPFARLPACPTRWVVAFVLLAVICEMAGVLMQTLGASRRYDGPMGKSDRAVACGALGLALGLGATPGPWLEVAFVIFSALGVWTLVRRVTRGLAERDAAPAGRA